MIFFFKKKKTKWGDVFTACNQQSIVVYSEYTRDQEEVILANMFGLEG